jgi:Family of unknown function (DUF6496)
MPYPPSYTKQDVTHEIMHRYKHNDLKSGSGHEVSSRKQAIAVALSEGKKYGHGK